jgi:hypothetical protein
VNEPDEEQEDEGRHGDEAEDDGPAGPFVESRSDFAGDLR